MAKLNRKRVLARAMAFADQHGLESLSMRKLGQQLGVEAMSLYKHVKNKDDLLDGLIELALDEIEIPREDDGWKDGMRRRARSARAMFARHPWAVSLVESRGNPGPTAMVYYDSVIGCLRRGGFDIAGAAHAFAVLDAFVFGFAVQERNLPFDSSEQVAALGTEVLAQLPQDRFPYFTEMLKEHALAPGYSYAAEFDFGLELILDGLERLLPGSS
ncbi:MAG: TetR/AcrR family transcriptional regulator C-terminal domain-containing protein [Myxococcota bacterium]